ncbi:ABC transporter ATP-binding protein [Lentisphaerota bacterium WC36G]|nr:ABC transporter ATP-binding protein [Lentisphaerae bacterium WC36]
MNKNNYILEIKDLTVKFANKIIVDKFSLKLKEGEKLILTGHSGCGKSTIIKAILGFIPIESGKIYINSEKLTEKNCWELRHNFGYVSQAPFTGFGTAHDFLMAPFSFKANREKNCSLEKIHKLMKLFNLQNDLLQKNVDKLSGGEKQRFAIVGTLLLEKKFLLLDEPTAALDKRNRKVFENFLAEKSNLTAIMITHDENSINNASQIINMTGGVKNVSN